MGPRSFFSGTVYKNRLFIFGGESIRGFMFALIVGVIVGTYSSVFIATPVMFDTQKKKALVEEKK